ncbi:Transcriptional repressor SdpR [uncultured Eubacteriales bacterium]|uniref:Transcriptional repressor SdpR n=1 Tax=uncultured Eubacteriales bacterium TaxID=172733 RepID=A0A212J6S3_9FIRM|nr:Transcriptional repressor SdpR [uncultured Eubacteriales bacterium]
MGFQETFKALSDPTRRRILDILKLGGRTAGEIGSQFDMTAATVSHHLAVLREAGLVDQDKRGKYVYYELNMSVLDELVGWVASLKGGDGDEEEHT